MLEEQRNMWGPLGKPNSVGASLYCRLHGRVQHKYKQMRFEASVMKGGSYQILQ